MTAYCASGCGHALPHALCSRHGEPYQLTRGCGCPPAATQTPTTQKGTATAPAESSRDGAVGTAPGPFAGQVMGRRAAGAAPQVSPSRTRTGNNGERGASDAPAALPVTAVPNPHPLANGYLDADQAEAAEWAHRVLTDTPNGDTWPVLEEVAAERARQDAKWGDQSHHPDGTGGEHRQHMARMDRWRCQQAAAHGTVTWQHILQEEVSEAFAETDPARLRTELIQIAAVCCQWAQAIDRRTGRTS